MRTQESSTTLAGGRSEFARRPTLIRLWVAALSALLVFSLAGCLGSGPSSEERAAQLTKALEGGGLGVSHAEVVPPASFSGSLIVTVTLEAKSLAPDQSLPADALKDLLHVVGRDATDMNVGYAIFYATDEEGANVEMAEAADQLGIGETVSDESLRLSKADLKRLATG